jgi:ATP-dependent Clp protease ATP-binding subunit ClpA
MGVTKQAAQKRFVAKARPAEDEAEAGAGAGEGFAHFSPRARNAVMAAQNEARASGNDRIGPAHLLMGLVGDSDTGAARVLAALGVPAVAARQAAAASLPAPAGEVPAIIPFDDGARAALAGAFTHAKRLGHDQVGTEHVLLSLLEQEGGSGTLTGLGVTPAGVEAPVRRG